MSIGEGVSSLDDFLTEGAATVVTALLIGVAGEVPSDRDFPFNAEKNVGGGLTVDEFEVTGGGELVGWLMGATENNSTVA